MLKRLHVHRAVPGTVLIFVAALTVRLVYLAESRSSPFFDAPIVDAQTYVEQAAQIAGGQLLGPPEPFWQPPLYPYFLGLIARAFPKPALFVAARVIQALLAAASCVLLYQLCRRVGLASAGAWVALAFALYGPLVYFDGELLAVTLETFLYLGFLTALLAAQDASSRSAWIGAGLVGGLCAVTRPNILLFIVLLPLWTRSTPHARTSSAERHQTRKLEPRWPFAWVLLGVAVAVAPVTARNWIAGGEPVLISSNGGINFYIGNNARYDSTVAIHPGHHWEELVLEPVREGHLSHAARSRYFFTKALSWAAAKPADYAGLLARKVWLLWSGPELKRNVNIHYARVHSRLLAALLWERVIAFPFGLVAPLALLGLALTARPRRPTVRLLRLFLATYGTSVVLFFVTARYRAPMVPVLLIFAGMGATGLAALLRAGRRRAVAAWSALLLVLVCVLNYPSGDPAPHRDAQLQRDLGEVHLRKQDYAKAAMYCRRALGLDPDLPSAHHNLALAYLGQGHYTQAAHHAQWVVDRVPRRADSRVVLARAWMKLGRWEAARSQLELALAGVPDLPQAHLYLGQLLLKSNAPQEALPHLQRAATQLEGFWIHYDLGRAYQASGDLDNAVSAYGRALAVERRAEGLAALGAVLLLKDEMGAGVHYSQAALEADPHQAEAHANLGYAALRQERYGAAVRHYRRALQLKPNMASAQRGLARAQQAAGNR